MKHWVPAKYFFLPLENPEPDYGQNKVPAKKIKVGTGGTYLCASSTGFRQVPADKVPANSSVPEDTDFADDLALIAQRAHDIEE